MQAFHIVMTVAFIGSQVVARHTGRRDDTLEAVKTLIRNANMALEEEGLAVVPTPDMSFNIPISRGNISQGSFGDLSTLTIVGDQQELNKTVKKQDTVISFNLTLGLNKLIVSYDFSYLFLSVFRGHGHAEIFARTNVAQVAGTVTIKKNGSCKAALSGAALTKLEDFQATVTPKNAFNGFLAAIVEYAKNNFLPSDIPIFNNLIAQEAQTKAFKKAFSKIACEAATNV